MMSPTTRKVLVTGLVACFGIQSWLVYTDDPSGVRLEGEALDGATAWHRHNCQSCHQFYGFGGFLGPDLTNAAGRLGEIGLRQRLTQVVTEGAGQMPAFDTDPAELDALVAFLVAMDRTGQGQARAGGSVQDFASASRAVLAEGSNSDTQRQVGAGLDALAERPCLACHQPFEETAVGAPPLATVALRMDAQALTEVLRVGKPPRMPAPTPPLSEAESGDVLAALDWLAKNGALVQGRMDGSSARLDWSELPWWEYR